MANSFLKDFLYTYQNILTTKIRYLTTTLRLSKFRIVPNYNLET